MVRLPQNEKQTYRLNSRNQMQSLSLTLAMSPWPLPWISKVKFWNSHISGIGGPVDIEQSRIIHDYDCDLLVANMRCKDLPDSDRGEFRCQTAVDSSSLN